MIIKILKRTAAFNGSWLYHFHDKKGSKGVTKTSERVEMFGIENIGTDDPEMAFKIMKMTWHSAANLKRLSNQSNKGRKCTKPLMTIVLSYSPQCTLSRDSLQADIRNILKMSGLTENQHVWVLHNDTDNPHVHLIVNTVHPETGIATQLKKSAVKDLQNWAKQQEINIGHIQSPGRFNPEQTTGTRKFIPAAERRARSRIGNDANGIEAADALAELTRQEWISLREKEKQESEIIRERIANLRKQTSVQRISIKTATTVQIQFIYKKKKGYIFSKEWFDHKDWQRLGKRIRAARRLFYIRERSLFGILMNSAHLSLRNTASDQSFTSYLLSKRARIEALETWIDSERKNLKDNQNVKRTHQVQQIRDAEHRAYANLSKSVKEKIQIENKRLEGTSQDFQRKRHILKESCKKRWDSLYPDSTSQKVNLPTPKIRKESYNDFNF